MATIKLACFDSKPYDVKFIEAENGKHNFAIKFFAERLGPDTVTLAAGHDVVCAFVNDQLDATVLDAIHAAGVKLVALRCAGYNNVDLAAAYEKIHVVRVPDYSPYAVAEHAVALMLTLNRKIHRAFPRVRDNNYSINGLLGFDMRGKTAGVVGTGHIGKILSGILRGFGMEVLVHDLYPDPAFAAASGCVYAPLDELYRKADIISLHCPLTPETHHLINAAAIAKMKRGVMLINTSRGKLLDTAALVDGLKSGAVGYAGLDVYEEESGYFFEDKSDEVMLDDMLARLNSFNNVIVTSHQAFFTKEALENIAATTLKNIALFFASGELPNEICYHCGKVPCPKKSSPEGKCF